MAAIIYKCPNCGGELVYDPSAGRYKCEYCGSDFDQKKLDELEPAQGEERQEEPARESDGREKSGEGAAVVYSCPSCGAQIVTDETTAATFCYYCHNPVVLSGRLSGEYLPDKIIPFAIDKKAATEQFLRYVGRKKFVPRAFFDKSQIEKLCGVYYPFWVYDCEADGSLEGDATKVRIWRTKDLEYTETSFFRVKRRGNIRLFHMMRNALKKSDRELVEGVQPFRMKEMKDFSMGYLSGFFAKRRDQEQKEFREGLEQEARQYAENLLRDTISGYSTVTLRENNIRIGQERWRYLLLPVWVLTYAGKNGKRYYYAMNGQTGTIYGELPVDYGRLGAVSGLLGLIVTLLSLLGGYLT